METLWIWLASGGLLALIASLTANGMQWWREWRKSKQETKDIRKQERRDTVDEYDALLRIRDKADVRRDAEIHSLNQIVALLSERCNDCDVDMANIYSFMRDLHRYADRMVKQIRKMGGEIDDLQPLPPKPKRRYPDSDFLARTTAQFTAAGLAASQADSGGLTLPPIAPEKEGESENSGS